MTIEEGQDDDDDDDDDDDADSLFGGCLKRELHCSRLTLPSFSGASGGG